MPEPVHDVTAPVLGSKGLVKLQHIHLIIRIGTTSMHAFLLH